MKRIRRELEAAVAPLAPPKAAGRIQQPIITSHLRQVRIRPAAAGPIDPHLSELQSGVISHALRFTACIECIGTQAVWPAITSSGLHSGAPPMGARFRLKTSFNTSVFPSYAAAVLTALKRYGMILAGTGPNGQISAATDVTADPNVYQQL